MATNLKPDMKIKTSLQFALVTLVACTGGAQPAKDPPDQSAITNKAPEPRTAHGFHIEETDERITLRGAVLDACIKKKGYVSGVEESTFLDKKTGARDLGFGLDIQDWIMEPGSDEAYRDQLPGDLAYVFGNLTHGRRAKRSIEGPVGYRGCLFPAFSQLTSLHLCLEEEARGGLLS